MNLLCIQGNDTAYGDEGNDSLIGGTDDDKLFGGVGKDTLRGGNGVDELHGDGDNDSLLGEDGKDFIWGDAGNDIALGGDEEDEIHGGGGDDLLFGEADGDALFGDAGNDTAIGDDGHDELHGGADDDSLIGGDDGDKLFGGAGQDILKGEGGVDTLSGGAYHDVLDGGDDSDWALYRNATGAVAADLGADTAANDGEGGTDELISIENIRGSEHDDLLIGQSAQPNQLMGGAGNDYIMGDPEPGPGSNRGGSYLPVDGSYELRFEVTYQIDSMVFTAPLSGIDADDTLVTGVVSYGFGEPKRSDGGLTLEASGTKLWFNIAQSSTDGPFWGGLGKDDTLDGGAGADTLVGGVGSDLFMLDVAPPPNTSGTVVAGDDTILDFNENEDRFQIGHLPEPDAGGSASLAASNPDTRYQITQHKGYVTLTSSGGGQTVIYGALAKDVAHQLISVEDGFTMHRDQYFRADLVTGDSGRDRLIVDSGGGDTITGGDTLTGGDGLDAFVIAAPAGSVVITDAAAGETVTVLRSVLAAGYADAASIKAAAVIDGAGVHVVLAPSQTSDQPSTHSGSTASIWGRARHTQNPQPAHNAGSGA